MPDIFGRDAGSYAHISSLSDAQQLGHVQAVARVSGGRNIYDALPTRNRGPQMPLADQEINAQSYGYLTNNLQAIQAQIEEILYLDFRLDELIPIVTDIPEGAKSYAYRVVDRAGEGSFISNAGTDANSAGASVRLVPYALEYGGIIPEWNFEDLRLAQFSGVALDSETVRAGVEGTLTHIERVGLEGEASAGFEGLINHSAITVTVEGTTLASRTPLQILRFLQDAAVKAISDTQEIFGRVMKRGMCFYVDIALADLLMTTPIGDNSDKSIWTFFMAHNSWSNYTGETPVLKVVSELAVAGGGASNRMLLGFNEPRVMEFAMPIAPRVINTIQKPFGVSTPMEYKISGLNVKRPGAMQYYDGV